MLGGLAEKEDLALLGVRGLGKEDEDGFFLIDTAQIKEVAVLMLASGAVGVGDGDIVGVDGRERLARKQYGKAQAVGREEFG
jgi:hypothetical protein